MIDLHSPVESLTIRLPTDLIAELQRLAQENHRSVDEVIQEACLAYTEPYIWERCYKEWRRTHPDEPSSKFGIDGDDLALYASKMAEMKAAVIAALDSK
jgi:hypothetical protein